VEEAAEVDMDQKKCRESDSQTGNLAGKERKKERKKEKKERKKETMVLCRCSRDKMFFKTGI